MAAALVLGGASCLWDDLRRLGDFPATVIAVNAVGIHYPGRIDHWVTLHPANFPVWESKREGNWDYTRWSESPPCDEELDSWGGSSGIYGARVALHLGFDRVVLCGVPLDERPHFHDSDRWSKGPWLVAKEHRRELDAIKDRLGNVRSMSGYTAEVLGTPTEEWLHGEA